MSTRHVRFPILVYHSIDEHGTPLSTHPRTFEQQVRFLADHGWKTISLSRAADTILSGRALPPQTCALTFDDAMESVMSVAAPILRDHGMSGTTFVITGLVGKQPAWYRLPEIYRRTPLLPVADLQKLADLGWELQPHTDVHPVLPHLPLDLQTEQIARSRQLIHNWFGSAGDVLAYPFGQFNADTLEAMRQAGCRAGVTLHFSCRVPVDQPLVWPRIGSAWLKSSSLRQRLALAGRLEWYVGLKTRLKGDPRARRFDSPSLETTCGLFDPASS